MTKAKEFLDLAGLAWGLTETQHLSGDLSGSLCGDLCGQWDRASDVDPESDYRGVADFLELRRTDIGRPAHLDDPVGSPAPALN